MKSSLSIAHRALFRQGRDAVVHQRVLFPLKPTHCRCMATLPPTSRVSNPPINIFPFAVDAADGTCEAVDAAEEQRVVNNFVEKEAEHAFCRHMEEDHVDFYGPSDGPLHATHPQEVLIKKKTHGKVSPQHLLAITPEDVVRTERENFMKVAVHLEDLQFCSQEVPSSSNPARFVAVDGPDGTPDDILQDDLAEVDHLIDEAAELEDAIFVKELHAKQEEAARIYAVESPDGTSDAARADEYEAVEDIVEYEAHMRDPAFVAVLHHEQQQIARIFAVESPDGTSDDAVEEDIHQIEEIIDHAAQYEDKEEVLQVHQEVEELKKTMSNSFPKGPFDLP